MLWYSAPSPSDIRTKVLVSVSEENIQTSKNKSKDQTHYISIPFLIKAKTALESFNDE